MIFQSIRSQLISAILAFNFSETMMRQIKLSLPVRNLMEVLVAYSADVSGHRDEFLNMTEALCTDSVQGCVKGFISL